MRGINSRWLRRLIILLCAIVVVVLAYAVAGFVITPRLARPRLEQALSESLGRKVTVRRVAVNPFRLTVSVEGIVIKNREDSGDFVRVERVFADAEMVSLWRRAAIVREVRIEGPRAVIIRTGKSAYNFSDLLTGQPKAPGGGPAPAFCVANIQVRNGAIEYRDQVTSAVHMIEGLNAGIPFVSHQAPCPDVFVTPMVEARLDGRPVEARGETRTVGDEQQTRFDLALRDQDIPSLFSLAPVKIGARIVSGSLDVFASVTYAQAPGRQPRIDVRGDIFLLGLGIRDRKDGPLLSLPGMKLQDLWLDPMAGKLHIDRVVIQAPAASVLLDQLGRLNALDLRPEMEASPLPAGGGSIPAGETEGGFEIGRASCRERV